MGQNELQLQRTRQIEWRWSSLHYRRLQRRNTLPSSGEFSWSRVPGSRADCYQGAIPVTLAEFTLDAGDGQTYYDISLVDGYNLPLAIVLVPHGNSSLDDIPPNLTNPSCEGTGSLLAPSNFNPYGSGTFLGTNSSYPLPFETKVTTSNANQWCPWDLQVRRQCISLSRR